MSHPRSHFGIIGSPAKTKRVQSSPSVAAGEAMWQDVSAVFAGRLSFCPQHFPVARVGLQEMTIAVFILVVDFDELRLGKAAQRLRRLIGWE